MSTTASLALLNIAPGQVVQTDLDLEAFLEADPEEPPYLEYEGDGLVRRKMSPTTEHGAIAAHLCGLLDHWQRQTGRRLYVYVELRTIAGSAARLPDVSVYRTRPPESSCNVVNALAATMACRVTGFVTSVLSTTRSVLIAAAAMSG